METMKLTMEKIMNIEIENSWSNKIAEIERELGISNIIQKTKHQRTIIIKETISHQHRAKMEEDEKDKNKIKHTLE